MASIAWKKATLRICENLSFFFAMTFLIPPPPSDISVVPHYLPAGIYTQVLFGISRGLAVRRGAESWFTALSQWIFMILYGVVLYEAVRMQ